MSFSDALFVGVRTYAKKRCLNARKILKALLPVGYPPCCATPEHIAEFGTGKFEQGTASSHRGRA